MHLLNKDNVNHSVHNWQGFFKAVEKNDIEEVKRLLGEGNIVIQRNVFEQSPLHFTKTKEMVEVLLNYGANVHVRDKNGNTFLHKVDRVDLVQVFLDYGINVNATNNYGATPLHMVKKVEVLQVLLARGANINATDKFGRTPLSVHIMSLLVKFVNGFITTEEVNQLEIIEFLMKNGARTRIKTVDQETDIVLFAEKISQIRSNNLSLRHLETVRRLVKSEVPVNQISESVLNTLDERIAEERQRGTGGSGGGTCSKGFE